jgi:hypothetical protein
MSGGFGANGKDNFSPMVGFAEGAGQLMTSLWLSESRYGGMFEGRSGWKVGIDGVYVGEDGEPYSSLAFNPVPYFGHHPVTERSDRKPDVVHDGPRLEIGIRTVVPVLRDGVPSLAAVPGGVLEIDPETLSGSFTLSADGTELTTQLGPQGFEVAVDPDAIAAGPVSFSGKAGEKALSFGPFDVFVDPPLSPTAMAPRGWIRTGDLADCNYPSLSSGTDKLVSTGDLGFGGLHPEPIGEVRTPPFLIWRDTLSFSWRGGAGCYIELTDARTDQMLLRTHGTPSEFQQEEWDLKQFRGARAVLRLIDPSKSASVSAIKLKMAG